MKAVILSGGKGIASKESLLNAIEYAINFANNKKILKEGVENYKSRT